MHLDKLFGSKAKVDILKYLLFRRQGVSMRALETELERTFPAIKKQIDSLKKASIVEIWSDKAKRSIVIKEGCEQTLKSIFIYGMQNQIKEAFGTYAIMIDSFYFWQLFGNTLDYDLIVIYKNCEKEQMEPLKKEINTIFSDHFIDRASFVFMWADERAKRYRLADKFVMNILKHNIKAHTMQ